MNLGKVNKLVTYTQVLTISYHTYQVVTIADYQHNKNCHGNKQDTESILPGGFAFQRIGGKYKGRILWFLKDGCLRYGELRRIVEGISPKMLTQALKELEADGLIDRKVYVEVPPRVEYRLTESSTALVPSIDLLRVWAILQISAER